jgi:hypothetical protein
MQVGERRGIILATSNPRVGVRIPPGAPPLTRQYGSRAKIRLQPGNALGNESYPPDMAKQRSRRGHIQLRSNGTFRAHVYAGRDPDHQEAAVPQRDGQDLRRCQEGPHASPARVDHQRSPTTSGTVGYLLSHWLEVADLELGTRDGYEGYIRRNIVPTLGDVPLRNGRRVVLQPSTPPLRPGLSQPCRVREQMAPAAASYHRCRIAIPRLQNRINPRGGRRSDRGSRLAVVPRRWVVERTLA